MQRKIKGAIQGGEQLPAEVGGEREEVELTRRRFATFEARVKLKREKKN